MADELRLGTLGDAVSNLRLGTLGFADDGGAVLNGGPSVPLGDPILNAGPSVPLGDPVLNAGPSVPLGIAPPDLFF